MTLTPRKTIGPFIIFERTPKPRGQTKYVVVGSKGDQDFGKYSTAIRWCKGQIPRPIPQVAVNMDEKVVTSTVPMRYTLIDGPFSNTGDALVDPEKVDKLFNKPLCQK